MQSCIISVARSRSVHIDQSKPRPTFNDAVIDLLEENKLDLNNSSTTESLQDESATDHHSNFTSVLRLRLKRHLLACEESIKREWNHCLGKYFPKVKCRTLSVACLSANNVPPKCKKNYVVVTGKNNRRCTVLTSCTCAA